MACGKDVAERLVAIRRPLLVLRRHLRRDNRATVPEFRFEDFADHPFAVAAAIRQRRIEECDALIERSPQRVAALTIVGPEPHLAAEPPPTEADLTDVVSGRDRKST